MEAFAHGRKDGEDLRTTGQARELERAGITRPRVPYANGSPAGHEGDSKRPELLSSVLRAAEAGGC